MPIPVFVFSRDSYSMIEESPWVKYTKTGFKVIMFEQNPQNIIHLFQKAASWCEENGFDFFLACSSRSSFTPNFEYKEFCSTIKYVKEKHGDVLICSTVGFDSPISIPNTNLYWVNNAFGINSLVIYRNAYKEILSLPKEWNLQIEVTGILISKLERKVLILPHIARGNKDDEYVSNRWKLCPPSMMNILKQQELYRKFYKPIIFNCEKLSIPVYIINLSERKERLEHVLGEFHGRSEFEVNIVPACKDECGALGLWKSIRKVVSIAMEKGEDIIIICEDDHQFTSDYSKEFLFTRIMEGYALGADYLNGGCGDFRDAFVITEHLFGMVTIRCTQFIIIYKDFFSTILNANFDKHVLADVKLSELTERKMVIYPFVSVQRDFGYSDVTMIFNQNDGLITSMFENARKRLENIKRLSEEEALLQHSKVINS